MTHYAELAEAPAFLFNRTDKGKGHMNIQCQRTLLQAGLFALATCMTHTGNASDATRAATTHDTTQTPIAFWSSQPVMGGDTIVASTANTSPSTMVEFEAVPDSNPGDPPVNGPVNVSTAGMTLMAPLQATTQSVKFLTPLQSSGVYAYSMIDPGTGNNPGPVTLVNVPDIWFVQGDQGSTVSSDGGHLRLYGTAMGGMSSTAGRRRLAFVQNGHVVATVLDDPSNSQLEAQYSASFPVAHLAPGKYELYFHNGSGGPAAWTHYTHFGLNENRSQAPTTTTTVTIAPPQSWPTGSCPVAAPHGNGQADDDRFASAFACAHNLAGSGGATIQLQSGRYTLSAEYALGFNLKIPNHSVIQGASDGTSELYFPHATGTDNGGTGQLLSGEANYTAGNPGGYDNNFAQGIFGVKNLTVTAPNMNSGYGISFAHMALKDLQSVPFLDGVTMNLGNTGNTGSIGVDAMGVSNLQIRNSHISAGQPVFMQFVHGASVSNCVLTWYNIGLVFRNSSENGVFTNNTLINSSSTNGLPKAFGAPTKDIYYADNTQQTAAIPNIYTGQYGMSLDEGRDFYFERIAGVNGNVTTLSSTLESDDLKAVNYTPLGMSAMVVSGKGAGQIRFITASDMQSQITLDRPWDVAPDSTSVLAVAETLGRMLFIHNNFDMDKAIEDDFYPSSDVIEAGNNLYGSLGGLQQQTGQYMTPNQYSPSQELFTGYVPGWHFQLLGNIVHQTTEPSTGLSGQGGLSTVIENKAPWFTGTVTQTNIIRHNEFDASAGGFVGLWDSVGNSLIENNYVPQVRLQNAYSMHDVLVRSNRTIGGAASALRSNQTYDQPPPTANVLIQ